MIQLSYEYDTIGDAILSCAQKLTQVSGISTARNQQLNRWKTEKLKSKQTDIEV